MSKSNNLSDFLTDIANQIRSMEGSSAYIPAQNFRSRISTLVLDRYYFSSATYTTTGSSTYSMTFSSMKGEPVAFAMIMTSSMGHGSSNNYLTHILYNGSTYYRGGLNSSGNLVCTTTGISTTYNSSTKKFTVTDNSSDGYYGTGTYRLMYLY